jgi:outer membrane protein
MLAILISLFSPSLFAEHDRWIIRFRTSYIAPDDSSGDISVNGANVAGSGVGVNEDLTPELDITYMLTPNIGLELILATSSHTVRARGSLSTLGRVIDTDVLPPTLTLQYHFNPNGRMRPYAGIGVNHTHFYNEDVEGPLEASGSRIKLDSSWGIAAQLGADYVVYKNWFINADLKYISIDSTARFSNTTAGSAKVDVDIDPIVLSVGFGHRF